MRLLRHRAHARRADDPGQDAGPAGRGLHRGARLRPRGRRHADHRLAEPARPRRDLHQPLRGARSRRPAGSRSRSSSSRPTTCACSTRSSAPASTRSASTPRRSTPRCSRAWRRARPSAGSRATSRRWERAVEVFGRGSVTTYVLLGMGERPELIIEGCRRAVEMGVYPFVVPLRPVPGHADGRRRRRRTPTTSARIYAEVSAMIADAGLDHLDAKAGCARCQACSGLSAWERVAKREEAAMETISSSAPRASARSAGSPTAPDELDAHFAVRRRVFVDDQALFAGTDRDELRRRAGHAARGRRGRRRGRRRRAAVPARRDGLWKGDRLAVLPEARVHQLGGAAGAASRSRTAGERGGHAMVAQVQVPNVRFFEQLGWARDGAAGALPRRHAPADGDPAGPSPVRGVRARSHTGASAPPGASRRTRRVVERRRTARRPARGA